ncbi:periplasmic binding protein-like I [Chytriomyces cf. hyalinus JEL632]|nr:periplasmic binding protein-like I [Chytriomyces cf. hyalinus JEL632]
MLHRTGFFLLINQKRVVKDFHTKNKKTGIACSRPSTAVRNDPSKAQKASSMAGRLINITLALVGNYCDFDYVQVNGSLVTNFKVSAEQSAIVSELYSTWTYFSDVAIQAAVGIVNDDPSILPGIHVTLKRFTDCGGWYPSVLDTYSGTSGGFATAIMANEIVEEHPDVVGVIGNQYSTTTIGPAEVLSLAQIPYCSGSAGTPRLSNRANYPYFWRTMTSLGAGEQMAALLKTWNVGRVAIIYQRDDNFGSESAKDILGSMRQNQIGVLENIGVKKSGLDNATIDYMSTLLHRVDARYFILSGQEDFQSTVYETLAEHGLVAPKYVWMSLLPINLKNRTLQQGFVLMQQRIPDSTTFLYREFLRRYTDISQMNVTMNEFDLGSYIAPLFDCTSMMLRGFEKLLKGSPGNDRARKLASRKLQSQMSFELFKGLGSDGLTEQPIDINSYGDLAAPLEVLFFNESRALGLITAGQMSVDGKYFSPYPSGQLLFFGGSSIPPPDGAPPISHHRLTSQAKAFVCSLFISGVIVCFLSAAFIASFRKHFEIKSMEVHYALIIHVGAFIGYSCIAVELLPDSITKCHLRTWLFILYLATTASPMLVKNLYVWYIFIATEELDIRRLSFKFHSLNIAIIAFDVLLLVLWSLTTRFQNELVHISPSRTMYSCIIPDQSFSPSVVLGAFNAILVLSFIPVLCVTRHVRPPWSDSTTMTLSFMLLSFLWTVVSALQLALEEINDLRRCLCIWMIVTGIIAIITVPRAYNVWHERKSRIAAHVLLHQTMDKVIASVTTPWKEKSGVQSPLMGRKTSQGCPLKRSNLCIILSFSYLECTVSESKKRFGDHGCSVWFLFIY